jgi:hypothetical protein
MGNARVITLACQEFCTLNTPRMVALRNELCLPRMLLSPTVHMLQKVTAISTVCSCTAMRNLHTLVCQIYRWYIPSSNTVETLSNSLFKNNILYTICWYVYSQLPTYQTLTLSLLMSYIYAAPCTARNFIVVYVWTYVWQR